MVQEHVEPEQYLTFFVGGEEVAINILRIREVIAHRTATRIPESPAYLRGVINLRGTVVPVVDLALKLGLPEAGLTKGACIVVTEVEVDGRLTWIGIMTEGVGHVVELSVRDIEKPPSIG